MDLEWIAGRVEYESLMRRLAGRPLQTILAQLSNELPYLWRDAYLRMTPRLTDIVRIKRGPFEYVFDDYATLQAMQRVPLDRTQEARIVAIYGCSAPPKIGRTKDDRRLRGWSGPTEKTYGKEWDKGHYMGHCLGGAVDGFELNVFIQRRELNRGWSSEGKRFTEMEKYCKVNAGTFCFARPLYGDGTSRPTFLEYGVLKTDGGLWVECFDNR